nr:hypothetical protein [Methylomarinovum caldicuralii]
MYQPEQIDQVENLRFLVQQAEKVFQLGDRGGVEALSGQVVEAGQLPPVLFLLGMAADEGSQVGDRGVVTLELIIDADPQLQPLVPGAVGFGDGLVQLGEGCPVTFQTGIDLGQQQVILGADLRLGFQPPFQQGGGLARLIQGEVELSQGSKRFTGLRLWQGTAVERLLQVTGGLAVISLGGIGGAQSAKQQGLFRLGAGFFPGAVAAVGSPDRNGADRAVFRPFPGCERSAG